MENLPALGSLYGRLFSDSSIRIDRGLAISGERFVLQLHQAGIRASSEAILDSLSLCVPYGKDDSVRTGIQYLETSKRYSPSRHHQYLAESTFLFNPWKELVVGELPLGFYRFNRESSTHSLSALITLSQNPHDGLLALQTLYRSFQSLPSDLRERFLDEIENDPCSIGMYFDQGVIAKSLLNPKRMALHARMLAFPLPAELPSIQGAIELLTRHNLCVDKKATLSTQLESIVTADFSHAPSEWREGELDLSTLRRGDLAQMHELIAPFEKPRRNAALLNL